MCKSTCSLCQVAQVFNQSQTKSIQVNSTPLKDSLHLAIKLVGAPYVAGGKTPSGFDCWGLVWYMFDQLGTTFPMSYSYALRANNKDLIALTENESKSESWDKLEQPEDGCVIALSRGKHIIHVGFWLHSELMVLHATDNGVVCESILDIKRKRNLTPSFYKWHQST
jgi:cell wall-associated NlpC family hydrolase